jgi:hypothetical protein
VWQAVALSWICNIRVQSADRVCIERSTEAIPR